MNDEINEQLKTERIKLKYLKMLQDITFYSINYCITDYEKVGIDETERTCIRNRAYTYLTNIMEFNTTQREKKNFKIYEYKYI